MTQPPTPNGPSSGPIEPKLDSPAKSKPVRRLLITGANGMIGHALRAAAAARGMEAIPVQRPVSDSRQAPAGPETILWEPAAAQPFAELERLEGFDAVVHLAGTNLASRRWSPDFKKVILESRTQPTGALALALARLRQPPRIFLSASATGFYGSQGDTVLREDAPAGNDFLSQVCQAWESATAPAVSAGMRVAHLRFGVVLSPFGGALKQMLPLFRMGLGGKLGSGRQWMSWITLEDLLDAIFHVMEHDELSGPVNVVAPGALPNAEFTRALGAALHRPTVLPAPAFALRLAFGEMADAALLASCRVAPAKLEAGGFSWKSPEAAEALSRMLAQPGKP